MEPSQGATKGALTDDVELVVRISVKTRKHTDIHAIVSRANGWTRSPRNHMTGFAIIPSPQARILGTLLVSYPRI